MLNYRRQFKCRRLLTVVGFLIAAITFLLSFNHLTNVQQSDEVSVSDSIVFSAKYARNDWGGDSGPGSRAENTVLYRKFLQKIFKSKPFQSFVDLGCGDFQIMKLIHIPANKTYRGIDVVPNIIKKNQQLFSVQGSVQFNLINDLRDLKLESELLRGADLLIVKDILIHQSNADIHYFIDNILSNVKFALITNGYTNDDDLNEEIPTGNYRPVDLTYPPFNLKNMELVLQYTYEKGESCKRVYFYTNPLFLNKNLNF